MKPTDIKQYARTHKSGPQKSLGEKTEASGTLQKTSRNKM